MLLYDRIYKMTRVRAQLPIDPSSVAVRSESPLASTVADRLKRLIAKKGRSFERLAALSGIDSDELLRIEAGVETPTINHLWRIANALGIPFGSLIASKGRRGVLVIRNDHPQIVSSRDGNCRTRALFPYDCHRPVEFYEVILAPHHIQHAGREAPERLNEGDAIDFLADVPHSYRNLGATPAAFYLVMSYEPGSVAECAS
jgi:transcriptional regulator with XRE-family HTH domain